jgi:glycerol-3-phosphate dehydrogenase
VKPLQTTIPIYSTFSGILSAPLRFLTHKSGKPQERGAFLIKVGLTIYDTFSRDGGMVPRHRFLGRKKSLAELPSLDPHIKYTATYYDASMHDPERLALDVLQDGRAAHPEAHALNYVEAIARDGDEVVLRDRESGTEFRVHADVVVNASGPWTDLTNDALGEDTRFMGGTKGSHIVLDNPALLEATGGREIFFEHEDGRIVLIYPLKGRVLVGTTDLEHDMTQPIRCTEAEVDYFFELVAHVFPQIPVDRSEIVFRFSGVRPLPRHDDEAPGFVSRDYRIEQTPLTELPGTTLLSLVGGKWTTFRALAEHMSTDILGLIGGTRTQSTEGLAIGGGKGFPTTDAATEIWLASNGEEIGRPRAAALLARYGTRAEPLIDELVNGDGAPDAALAGAADYSRREIAYIVATEQPVHLIDLVLRRTSLAFVGALSADLLGELADILAAGLGWDETRRATEIAATRAELAEVHGVRLGTATSTTSLAGV